MPTFDLESLSRQIMDFSREIPRILRQSVNTLDIADEVERCLSSADDAAFKLAVVGRMKVGKSTLINALVGEDLAITGVTETTATINRLLYGTADEAKTFRVKWKNIERAAEIRNLAERVQWTGDSQLAKDTRFLEFFSTAAFLKRVEIIDTPGTGSVMEAHEQVTMDFLEQHDRDTRYYGASADCVLYVLPPVARERDRTLLDDFGAHTRLPNTSAYNSVAVLHRWELLDHPQPWLEAARLAEESFKHLEQCVSTVIPVSGLLKMAADRCSQNFWREAARLVQGTPPDVLRKLMLTDERFLTRTEPLCPFDAPLRRQLWLSSAIEPPVRLPNGDVEQVPLIWPCFTAILKIALYGNHSDAESLKKAVQEASGMDRLLRLLNERFFDRARLIKSSNLLNKLLKPTDKAILRLRLRRADLGKRIVGATNAIAELDQSSRNLAASKVFIHEAKREAEAEAETIGRQLPELEAATASVRDAFQKFEADLKAVRVLQEHLHEFDETEVVEIMTLLGAYGASLSERLSKILGENDDKLEAVHRDHESWLERFESARGNRRLVLKQILVRLGEAIAELETTTTAR